MEPSLTTISFGTRGDTARVDDENWLFVEELPVATEGVLNAVTGKNTFRVTAPDSPDTWLSSRIKVMDTEHPMVVPKPRRAE